MSAQQENTKALKALFVKYLNGEATAEERERIELWYAALEKEPQAMGRGSTDQSKARMRNTILRQVTQATMGARNTRIIKPVLKYAASILLICGLTFIYLEYKNIANVAATAKVIETTSGIQKNVVLADGSRILLNEESRLIISGDFNKKERKVILIGEAFFHIAKDRTRPFVIRSGDLKTTVLGTSFNINAYPGQENIKIGVATGKVKVARTIDDGTEGILSDGMVKDQVLVFNNQTKTAQIKQGNTALLSSWDKGELYIDDASIPDIAKQLERHYKLPVSVSPKIRSSDHYTVKLGSEPMSTSIRVLSDLTHLRFIFKQNQLYIMKRK